MTAAGESPTVTVRCRDGRPITLREARPDDEAAIREFLAGLCLEARRLRFFSAAVDLGRVTHTLAASRPGCISLVATDRAGAIVGHAVCLGLSPGRGEVAVEVADELHAQGLGTILIERLAELAERNGTSTLVAQVLPENRAMLEVLTDGFDAHARLLDGVDTVEFPTSAWRLARRRYPRMFSRRGTKTTPRPATHR